MRTTPPAAKFLHICCSYVPASAGIAFSRINRLLDTSHYDEYRKKGYPIGSGMVEGSCKFVVCKRFKGSGMRWKREDNESVLKLRLAIINDTLHREFEPKPMRGIRYVA